MKIKRCAVKRKGVVDDDAPIPGCRREIISYRTANLEHAESAWVADVYDLFEIVDAHGDIEVSVDKNYDVDYFIMLVDK